MFWMSSKGIYMHPQRLDKLPSTVMDPSPQVPISSFLTAGPFPHLATVVPVDEYDVTSEFGMELGVRGHGPHGRPDDELELALSCHQLQQEIRGGVGVVVMAQVEGDEPDLGATEEQPSQCRVPGVKAVRGTSARKKGMHGSADVDQATT